MVTGVAASATRPHPDPSHSVAPLPPLGEARHVEAAPAGSQHSGGCYKCPFCSKLFEKRWFLQRHVRIHTGDKPFRCQLCPATFNQKGNLVVHTRRHTGDHHWASSVVPVDKGNGSVQYQCSLCPYMTTRRGNIRLHQVTHSDQHPFLCPLCFRAFKRNHHLKRHLLKKHPRL
nr:zinc finger protein ZFP2-like [Dermacentor andersoni]